MLIIIKSDIDKIEYDALAKRAKLALQACNRETDL
jgi:hypothetical protein